MAPRFPDGYPPGHAYSQRETVAQFLDRREQELLAQASALRGQIEANNTELAQIKKMKSLVIDARDAGLTDLASDAVIGTILEEVPTRIPDTLLINGRIVRLTIKIMILAALRDHFKSEGATPSDIRDYIKSAYDREIDRNSISPQLARLREQGAVEQYGFDGKWKLTRAGAMFDHPTSWKDLDKDEPPDPNAPNTRLGDVVARPKKKGDDFLE